MQKFLLIKCAIIGVLCVLFVIALTMINGLVYERKNYEQSVIDEIAQTQIGSQTLTTPFVVAQTGTIVSPIVPSTSEMVGTLAVKNGEYARGIYKATSYNANLTVKQNYAISHAPQSATTPLPTQTPAPTPKSYRLIIPVSDLRGVILPKVVVNDTEYTAKFGTSSFNSLNNNQFLEVDLGQAVPSEINFKLDLSGLTGLSVVPLGDNSTVSLTGDWSEPKFYGDALPTQKTINQTGFNATWQNAFLAQQNNSTLIQNFTPCENCATSELNKISTDFINTNNAYTKTDRTIKYALILLIVSFGTFFLFEIIKGLKIHPIQYLLVASGLLIFYVLLLSLAELIAFAQAYAIASIACVSLISWYAFFMLKSIARSVIFGGILGGLYGGFYVILSVAEMNLLLGSVFCFVLLFIVMFITRHIDWYKLGNKGDDKVNDDDDNEFIHAQGASHAD